MARPVSRAIKRDRIVINCVPIIISVIAFFCIERQLKVGTLMSEQDGLSLLETMIGVWGTLLGFMITAASILLAFNDGTIIKMLKDTGHYKTILICYVSCCIHLLIAVTFACICIFGRFWGNKWFCLICSLAIDTTLMVALCLYFLFAIVLKQE